MDFYLFNIFFLKGLNIFSHVCFLFILLISLLRPPKKSNHLMGIEKNKFLFGC